MITTTLGRIRAHNPCGLDPTEIPLTGYRKLAAFLGPNHGPDDPVPFSEIIESNGLDDALWCCIAEPQHAKDWRLFAVWCARNVQHLTDDPRPAHALDVAERHANGLATDGDLKLEAAAARAAALAAARGSAFPARAGAACAALAAARGSARAAAWASAECAAKDAAKDAATASARASGWDAARDGQTIKFLEIVT